jgi:hypothetical protein
VAEVEVERSGGDAAGLPVIGGRDVLYITFTCVVGQLFFARNHRRPVFMLVCNTIWPEVRSRAVSGTSASELSLAYIAYSLYCITLPILFALLLHTVLLFVSFHRLQARIG